MGMNLKELTIYRLNNNSNGPTTIPNAPSNIQKIATSNSVTLSWQDNANNELGFKIYQGNTLIATLPENTTEYTLSSLTANTSYEFSIIAYNNKGDSSSSPVISIVTKDNYAWLIPVYHLILN